MKIDNFLQNKSRKLFNTVKSAFSLSEALITLTILGVIAALYIPYLYAQFQEKAFLTAYKKALSLMQKAVIEAEAENADMSNWSRAKGIVGDTTEDASINPTYTFKYRDKNGKNPDFKAFLRDRFSVKKIDTTSGDVTLIDDIVILGAGNFNLSCTESKPCVFAVDVNGPAGPNEFTITDNGKAKVKDRFFILVGATSVGGLDSTKVGDFSVTAYYSGNMTNILTTPTIIQQHITAMRQVMGI